ncbi:hypothetical protein [Methylobacterium tarhaniae]|uniref:hypothetical protein n=1 Tax=Methylobacterium tarhaniae TaxID=1187852 RepID=UPI000A703032|nr:hypothetical protein [Methylobacterium tarhaniae]
MLLQFFGQRLNQHSWQANIAAILKQLNQPAQRRDMTFKITNLLLDMSNEYPGWLGHG